LPLRLCAKRPERPETAPSQLLLLSAISRS
jgi:hypothetical protein